jgi:hypothetical protein
VKWILCAGCDEYRLVDPRGRTCSGRCRTRLWRRAHGACVERLAFCAWCQAPLLYLPQDRLPSRRRYCHGRCARKAWLVARARRDLTGVAALEIAIRKLRRSRYPRHLAAAHALTALRQELMDRPTGSSSTTSPRPSSLRDATPLTMEVAG